MKETLNKEALRFIRYLGFKMDCLREQEANPLTIDVAKAQRHSDELEIIVTEKVEALSKVMPKIPVISKRKKPAVMIKADGSLSAHGVKWYALLKSMHLPATTEGTIDVIDSHKVGNPKSPAQVKEWLQMLGWEPCTFKYDRNKVTGEEKKIPQIRYVSPSDPRKGLLTESVLRLKSREPGIEILEGLTVAAHRKSIFDGFIDKSKDGKAVAEAGGFTNTLRLKHRAPVVNLPKVGSAWGEEIRGCIVAPAGEVVCGADVSSLESCTKRHYMWDYDPAYVTEMSVEGFDEHLNLAVFAKEITQDEEEFFQWYQKNN